MRLKQKTKMRKSTRYMYILLSISLLMLFTYRLIVNSSKESAINTKKEIYSYTSKFNYDYNVDLLENEFISKDSLGMDYVAYVTDLIDVISLNMNYKFTGSEPSKVSYEYLVTGKLNGVYSKDGDEQKIWEENETLIDKKSSSTNNGEISISEPLELDLKEKNSLVKRFEQQMGMSLTTKYLVTFEVKINTVVNGETITNKDKKTISIDLGKKTTTITGKNNDENTEYVSKDYTEKSKNNTIQICLDIFAIVVAVYMLKYVSKTKSANRIKNEYRQEINRILRLCQDKIVKLDTRPNEAEKEVIRVKDFGEIIKLSEELFKPILYWEDKESEESWFVVMSNSMLYHYIIKRGD